MDHLKCIEEYLVTLGGQIHVTVQLDFDRNFIKTIKKNSQFFY